MDWIQIVKRYFYILVIDIHVPKWILTYMKKQWSASDTSNPINISSIGIVEPIIEFQDNKGEWHNFHIIATQERIVFGGACNTGFIESGYLEREEGESIDRGLQELLEDLEVYYNDGPQYVSRIVCNERM